MNTPLYLFVIRRVAAAMLFVVAVSMASLTLVYLAPGDAVDIELGRDPDVVAAERERLGLNRTLPEHLVAWLSGVARFDLGQSSSNPGRPVSALVLDRALHTARLASVALVGAVLVGVPIGILTGGRPRGATAAIVAPLSIALVSCPPIVAALGLMLLALQSGVLSIAPGSIVVPALALGLPLAALLERVQSQATTEAVRSPDLIASAARGVPSWRLLWLHAGRQSLRPVLGVFGLVISGLFSGSLAVEVVTTWPGLGRLTFDALFARDLYLVAGCAFCGAALIAFGNLLADLLRVAVDPRLQSEVGT